MNFYSGKRVVVTGGAGFLGSVLTQMLLDADVQQVTILDNDSRRGRIVDGWDAAKFDNCNKAFESADIVFNLAASVAGVTYNESHSAEMFSANIRLQTTPVLAAVALQVPHFLQVSSVCVYAEEYQNPCLEINGWQREPNPANAGYAWAKRMGERVALWSDLPHVVIVRPANLYGPSDYHDEKAHVIPALVDKILKDNVIRVRGTGREIREFLYVEDAARALMVAMERGEHRGIYNIGSNGNSACSIEDLVHRLYDRLLILDKPIEFTGKTSGDERRIVNADKLMHLGWQPQVSLDEGLDRVCQEALASVAFA